MQLIFDNQLKIALFMADCYSSSDHKTIVTDKDKSEGQEILMSKQANTSFSKDKNRDQPLTKRTENKIEHKQEQQQKPVIPGLGAYSDSSDSEASSSDSCNE